MRDKPDNTGSLNLSRDRNTANEAGSVCYWPLKRNVLNYINRREQSAGFMLLCVVSIVTKKNNLSYPT